MTTTRGSLFADVCRESQPDLVAIGDGAEECGICILPEPEPNPDPTPDRKMGMSDVDGEMRVNITGSWSSSSTPIDGLEVEATGCNGGGARC